MSTSPLNPQDTILKQIENGTLCMRPRILFTLRFLAVLGTALVVLLLSSYVGSLILFSLEEGGEELLLGFGMRGVLTFLALFPWRLLLVDIVAIVVLRFLLQGLRPIYRFSFSTVLLVLGIASVLLALLISSTPLHRFLLERALTDELPLIGGLYNDLHTPDESQGEFRGTIIRIEGRTLIIAHDDGDHDADDGVRIITVPESADMATFTIGEEVYVAGEEFGLSEHIKAYGIQKIHRSDEREHEER
jgi:hypothetical protein